MNDRAPLSELTSDDEFDAQLRATIARAEPMSLPPERYLRRVRLVVARRVALALLLVAVVCGALVLRSAIQANSRFKRLLPEWLLATAPPTPTPPLGAVVAVQPAPVPEATMELLRPPAEPASTTPPLTREEANRPFQAKRHKFEKCFPETGGSVLLIFNINEAGKAVDLTVEGKPPLRAPGVACVRRVVSELQWPLSAGGNQVTMKLVVK